MNTAYELMNELIEGVNEAQAKRKLTQKKPGVKRGTVNVSDMSEDERREYNAEKAREYQARLADELENGGIPLVTKFMREALADAAIAILATGANGSKEIEAILGTIYQNKPAAVTKIKADIRRGKLKAKLLKAK